MISHAVSGSHVIFNKSPPPHILQHSYLKCVQSWVTGWVKKLEPLMLLRRIIQSHPDTTLSLFSSLNLGAFDAIRLMQRTPTVRWCRWVEDKKETEAQRSHEGRGVGQDKGNKRIYCRSEQILMFFNSMIRVGMWHSPNCCKWPNALRVIQEWWKARNLRMKRADEREIIINHSRGLNQADEFERKRGLKVYCIHSSGYTHTHTCVRCRCSYSR